MALLEKITTVEEIKSELQGKRVLVRVDFNVPIEQGRVTDTTRIVESLPTIKFLINNGAKVILMSHLGRPKKPSPEFSLKPVQEELAKLLGEKVEFVDDCIGTKVTEYVSKMKQGDVVLLENVRFYKEEEQNDKEFARKLAQNADIFVSDAFGSAHRAHASVCAVAEFLKPAAGFLMIKEIKYLSRLLEDPQKPFVAVLGGAKVSDKIKVIKNLLKRVDKILIAGGMAFTFLKAKGVDVGASKTEDDKLELAREILSEAEKKNIKVVLPVDFVVAQEIKPDAKTQTTEGNVPAGMLGLDIGPESINLFKKELADAKTVFWNGPVGVFEVEAFSRGTQEIAQCLGQLNATVVIGGGDTASAAEKYKIKDKVSHVSTGGGASLEFIEGAELPGIAALYKK